MKDPIKDPKVLKEALEYARHSLYLSGMDMTEEDMKNVMTVLTGKMTMQELIEKLKEIGRSK